MSGKALAAGIHAVENRPLAPCRLQKPDLLGVAIEWCWTGSHNHVARLRRYNSAKLDRQAKQINPVFGIMMNRAILILVFILFASQTVTADEKPKLILDADTANEIDDMYAIARMLNQDKFEVIALTSTQWIHYLAEPDSVEASQRENEALVKLLGRQDLPTPIGSKEPMGKPWGGDEAKDSPAAQFIIEAAKKASPENKLTVVCLGASTNLASAIKLAPEIAPNIDAYLLGFRYDLEKSVWNKSSFNVRRDLNAADFVLNQKDLKLTVMPANVAKPLTFPRDETFAKHEKLGDLGAHLTTKWKARFAEFENWVMWDLALVQAILDPSKATTREVMTPPENVQRKVRLFESIKVDAMRQDYWSAVMPASR